LIRKFNGIFDIYRERQAFYKFFHKREREREKERERERERIKYIKILLI